MHYSERKDSTQGSSVLPRETCSQGDVIPGRRAAQGDVLPRETCSQGEAQRRFTHKEQEPQGSWEPGTPGQDHAPPEASELGEPRGGDLCIQGPGGPPGIWLTPRKRWGHVPLASGGGQNLCCLPSPARHLNLGSDTQAEEVRVYPKRGNSAPP